MTRFKRTWNSYSEPLTHTKTKFGCHCQKKKRCTVHHSNIRGMNECAVAVFSASLAHMHVYSVFARLIIYKCCSCYIATQNLLYEGLKLKRSITTKTYKCQTKLQNSTIVYITYNDLYVVGLVNQHFKQYINFSKWSEWL